MLRSLKKFIIRYYVMNFNNFRIQSRMISFFNKDNTAEIKIKTIYIK